MDTNLPEKQLFKPSQKGECSESWGFFSGEKQVNKTHVTCPSRRFKSTRKIEIKIDEHRASLVEKETRKFNFCPIISIIIEWVAPRTIENVLKLTKKPKRIN